MNAPQGRHWPQTSQKAQPGSQTKAKGTRYVAHEPDARGRIHYSDQENATWQTLMARQMALVEGRVCREYRQGLERLALPEDRIPQLGEIDRVLEAATGWRTARVPALIPFTRLAKPRSS